MMNLVARVVCLVIGLLVSSLALVANAAEKYKLGEEVQVLFLGDWLPAVVRDTDKKGNVLCEFEFATAVQQRIFNANEIRRPYEAGAIARGRTWSDATGKYNIKAALLKISGGKVDLRGEDMKEVSIPIEKLSTQDQSYIKQFQSKAGLAAVPVPRQPEPEYFSDTNTINIFSKSKRWGPTEDAHTEETKLSLAADPVRKGLQLQQAGVGFPALNFHEKVSSLLALGGADNWILASIGESDEQPTRLMWVSLTKQAVKRIQMLPAGEMLVDYHAPSRQLLTYNQRKIDWKTYEPVVTVWQTEPSAEEPKVVASWHATITDDKSWHHSVPWLRFGSDSLVIQRTETHRILAWDFKARSLAWQTTQDSFFAPEPRLSAGGKYLLVPEDSGLRICDTLTGVQLGQVPMYRCSGVAAHSEGSLIAVLTRDTLYVVDITGSQPIRTFKATGVGNSISANFDWVGNDLLSFEGAMGSLVMYSLKHELPIWSYQFESEAFWGQVSGAVRKRSIVDDHLVYAATFRVASQHGLAVGAVRLPSKKASAAMETAKRDDFLALKKGSRVNVVVSAIDHGNEIRQALLNEIKANGWVYDPTSSNVIQVEYKRGEAQEIRYELHSMRGGRNVQSATITPYVANTKVLVNKEDAWAYVSSSGPPSIVTLRDGESLQSEVERGNQPMWSTFAAIDIPADIVDPKKRGGLGTTQISNRGLVENDEKK